MEYSKFKERCPKHPDEKIEFFRINYSDNSKGSQPFFCCMFCKNEDNIIKLDDYQSIKYILKSNSNEIIRKWPPIQNQEIIDNLFERTKGKQCTSNIIQQVIQFFSDLKKTIIKKIDKQQKKMIKIAESIPEKMSLNQIVKEYKYISKIEELKKELLNQNSTLCQKENICKELVQQSQTEQNTLLLQTLLNNISYNIMYDNESALIEQQSILNSIKKINLFKSVPQQHSLINKQKIDVNLMKTEFENGSACLLISQNTYNQQQVINIQQNDYYHNTVTDIILDPNLKYNFRFQIDNLEKENRVFIGLISDEKKQTQVGYTENLCCFLQNNKDNLITKVSSYGIKKNLKGDKFQLSAERQVEMRVHIKEKIVELLDYPNYQYKIGLDDEFTPYLIHAKDLRIVLGLGYKNNKITLINAQIVNNFD